MLVAVPLALAAINFLWQLDSPSLYIDEAISWGIAIQPLGEILHHVRVDEISPWTHYVGLHEWIGRLGSEDEWVMRLPSALAGVALVGVVYRVGLLTAGPRAALLGSVLAAMSPLLLNYAQQARAYIWATLLVALAVLAALEAERAETRRGRRIGLALCVASSIAAVWLHYTAGLVLVALFAWVLTRPFRPRAKLAAAAALVVGAAPLVPLYLDQVSRGHQEGIADSARFTLDNLLQVLGAPFDGRSGHATPLLIVGTAALLLAAAVVARKAREHAGPLERLVLPAAIVPLVLVVAVTLVADDVLISRYVVVAAPFMALLVGAAADSAPRLLGWGLVAAAIVGTVGGSLSMHRQEGFHPDVRGAFEAIAAGYEDGDAIVLFGYPRIGPVGNYYRRVGVPEDAQVVRVPEEESAYSQAVADRKRLWFLSSEVSSRAALSRSLASIDYRLGAERVLPAAGDLQLVLALPRKTRPG